MNNEPDALTDLIENAFPEQLKQQFATSAARRRLQQALFSDDVVRNVYGPKLKPEAKAALDAARIETGLAPLFVERPWSASVVKILRDLGQMPLSIAANIPGRYEAVLRRFWSIHDRLELENAATLSTGEANRIETWMLRVGAAGTAISEKIECACPSFRCNGEEVKSEWLIDRSLGPELLQPDCCALFWYAPPRQRRLPKNPSIKDVVDDGELVTVCWLHAEPEPDAKTLRVRGVGEPLLGRGVPHSIDNAANIRVLVVPPAPRSTTT